MTFVGSYTHSVDGKLRVFIPAKFRDELGPVFYITRKCDAYLSVYTAEDWEIYSEKIAKLPEAEAYAVQEFILGAAQKCIPDSNGRVILEKNLLAHIGIKTPIGKDQNSNVVFIGAGKQIRIWSEDEWNKRERERDLASLRDIMSKYGL